MTLSALPVGAAAPPTPQLHTVPLYLRDSPAPLSLTPAQPTKAEGTSSTVLLGTPLLGVPMSTFRTQEVSRSVAVDGQVGVTLYFVSKDNARNAWVDIAILNNGAVELELSSNNAKKDLSSTPTEISVQGTLHTTLNASAVLSIQGVFHADLRPPSGINPLPQPADSRLLYDGIATPSHVSLTTQLLEVSFDLATVDADNKEVVFPFALREIFPSGGGTITYLPELSGPGGPINADDYAGEEVGPIDDGVSVQVVWDLSNRSHPKDGRYELKVTASYNPNGTFLNSTTYDLDLPAGRDDGTGPGLKLDQLIGPLVALAIGGVIVLLVIQRQRSGGRGGGRGRHGGRPRRRAAPDTDPQEDDELAADDDGR